MRKGEFPAQHIYVPLAEVGPMTLRELAIYLRLTLSPVVQGMKRLRRDGRVHIAAWSPPVYRGHWAPIYAAGPGVDVPKPKRKKVADYSRKYRQENAKLIKLRRSTKPASPWKGLL